MVLEVRFDPQPAQYSVVLILLWVEYGLGGLVVVRVDMAGRQVLILLWVEYGLGDSNSLR